MGILTRFRQIISLSILSFIVFIFSVPAFASTNTSEDTEVVLQLRWDHQFQFAGYYAAEWLGFYEAEGIKVEIRSAFQDGIILDGPTEINEGRADFGVGAANILMAQDSGIDLTLVASIFQEVPLNTAPY